MKNKRVIVIFVGILISTCSATAVTYAQLQKVSNVLELVGITIVSVTLGTVLGVTYVLSKLLPDRQEAWYLDEDVLLAGYTDAMVFYPNKTTQCGFDAQAYTDDDVNKTLFYALEKAEEVCGSVRVIT